MSGFIDLSDPEMAPIVNEMDVGLQLGALASELGLDPDVIQPSVDIVLRSLRLEVWTGFDTYRAIRITPASDQVDLTAQSAKTSNLILNKQRTIEMLSRLTFPMAAVITRPHPILIAAGIALVMYAFRDASSIALSAREASVLWGLIQATGRGYVAEEAAIVQRTNEERERTNLLPLTSEQIETTLHSLESLKCVEAVRGQTQAWRLIERIEVGV